MRRNEQVWWVTATVLSLAAFSFFAGLGMRGLLERMAHGEQVSRSPLLYPRVASAAPGVPGDADLRPATLYMEVLNKLRLYYVEKLPGNTELSYGSVDAMLNSLGDPNTRLLSKAEMEALQKAGQGEFLGMGAILTIRRHSQRTENLPPMEEARPPAGQGARPPSGIKTLTVVSVAPGGPAEKAGLRPGDRITEIDGRWVAPAHISYRVLTQLTDPLGPQDGPPPDPDDPPTPVRPDPQREKERREAEEERTRWKNATDLPTAMQLLSSSRQGEHALTVERGNPAQTLKVRVTLGTTTVTPHEARSLDETTGYLRLLVLSSGTAEQVREILAGFREKGVRKLVVDLRNSPGGSLDAALEVAGMLLGEVRFAALKERDAARREVDRPLLTRGAEAVLAPDAVSVLVDGGTAGAAELLAAALRDHLGARLVGTATFGDGTQQELIRLENGAGVSITRARLLTSRGAGFEGTGLQADMAVQGDPVEAARRALAGPKMAGAARGPQSAAGATARGAQR